MLHDPLSSIDPTEIRCVSGRDGSDTRGYLITLEPLVCTPMIDAFRITTAQLSEHKGSGWWSRGLYENRRVSKHLQVGNEQKGGERVLLNSHRSWARSDKVKQESGRFQTMWIFVFHLSHIPSMSFSQTHRLNWDVYSKTWKNGIKRYPYFTAVVEIGRFDDEIGLKIVRHLADLLGAGRCSGCGQGSCWRNCRRDGATVDWMSSRGCTWPTAMTSRISHHPRDGRRPLLVRFNWRPLLLAIDPLLIHNVII